MTTTAMTAPNHPPLTVTAVLVSALITLGGSPANASERELGSHEHGAASLDIAVDGKHVYLDLTSPIDNVLGFEHAPATDEQKARAANTTQQLSDAGLYQLDPAANCQLEEVSVNFDFPSAEGDEHAEGEEHDEHDHDAEHDKHGEGEEHDEHDDDAEHDEHEEGDEQDEYGDTTHGNVTVAHSYTCKSLDQLQGIRAMLFEQFDGFEDISVQMVGPGGQDGARLTADEPAAELGSIL